MKKGWDVFMGRCWHDCGAIGRYMLMAAIQIQTKTDTPNEDKRRTVYKNFIYAQYVSRHRNAGDTHEKSHGLMMEYNGYPLGHTQLKPIQNQNGTLKSTMPRWMTQTSRAVCNPLSSTIVFNVSMTVNRA